MFAILQITNENKVYRRRKKRLKNISKASTPINFSKADIFQNGSKIIQFLLSSNQKDIKPCKEIEIPKKLNFREGFNDCSRILSEIVWSYYKSPGHLVIDFAKCEEASVSALVVIKTMIRELSLLGIKSSENRYKRNPKLIKIKPSESDKINRYINSLRIAKIKVSEEEKRLFLGLGLLKGKSRNYKENRKAVVSRKITDFVETTVEPFNVGFDERGKNYMEKMVGEILSNAEDHSLQNSEWFVDGVSFIHKDDGKEVIEFNLVIVNYGDSMFEGFEKTKSENHDMYNKLDKKYQIHKKLFTPLLSFEKESLFVLYMLNEGISRLKFKEPSRGNGTMNFIKNFIELGKFGNEDKSYCPELSIISGHTMLRCNEEYAPFKEDTHYKLTLNKEQTLDKLPNKKMLKYHTKAFFPGTILECKIFFNKEDLKKHIELRDSEIKKN